MSKNNKNRYNSPVEKNDSTKKIETIITEENIQSISEKQEEITVTPVVPKEIEKIESEIIVEKVKVISNDGRTMMIKYPDGRYALIPATSAKNGDYIEI